MEQNEELEEFLRSRRERLAGVGAGCYVRLEQGRTARASDQVLDAVARASPPENALRLFATWTSRPTRPRSTHRNTTGP